MASHALIDVDDSFLIVVDVQDNFTSKLRPEQVPPLLERVCWLVQVARWCRVPVLVTVEDTATAGGPSPEVAHCLSAEVPVLNKMVFGLADQPDLLQVVEDSWRRTMVLVGLETDVCILHSALSLTARGYRAVVVADATCSPGESHAAGLARLRDAGVLITDTKGLFYEWLRTVERSRHFHRENPALTVPAGLQL